MDPRDVVCSGKKAANLRVDVDAYSIMPVSSHGSARDIRSRFVFSGESRARANKQTAIISLNLGDVCLKSKHRLSIANEDVGLECG